MIAKMAGMRGLIAFLLMKTAFASPHPALVARQTTGTCAVPTCAATGRAEIQEGAACLCSAGTSFRDSICNGHPPLTSVFTTLPRTVTSTTVIWTTRPATTEYTTPPYTRTIRRSTSVDVTSTITNNVTSVSGTITTTVAFETVTSFTTITQSTCRNSPGTGDAFIPEITPPPTTNPALMRRQDATSYNCSPYSSWYASYSSENGAGAVRSACSCLRGGNESTRTTIVTRYSTIVASTRTRRSTSRSGTLTTRSTVLTTTTSTRGSTILSTETSITTVPAVIPVTGTTTITSTITTQVPISAPSSFRLYYNLNGGRQYAVAARRPGQDDQDTRFLSSTPSNGDTFTLDTSGRIIDTQGANAIAVATDEAPYKYLYLDQDINNHGPNVPTCTWCNGPLSCDYPDSGNSSSSNSTNFYSCGGGFLVLSESNAWVEGSSCQRVTIRLEVANGGEAGPGTTTEGETSTTESDTVTSPTSGATTTTDDNTTTEPSSDSTTATDAPTTTNDSTTTPEPTSEPTDNPPLLRKYGFLG
ncbi:hypothetical protein HII31_02784 [Pseudocercospora fuligena]|uniref:EGF-like domain-containing protein n=1 Tax=Pseudocercospora fuligena TaxID=685502 RepID=A0A8H6RRJ3_9PEZI|nr:hypothetical protein HII31_02784 [Pseudocercospora fuligena]